MKVQFIRYGLNRGLRIISLLLIGTFINSSCGQKQSQEGDENQDAEMELSDVSSNHRMPVYDFSETVDVGSKKCKYVLHRDVDESLAKVKDEQGTEYADNFYQLDIYRGGTSFFSKRFNKNDFVSVLDKDFQKNGIFDGFRYSYSANGIMYFSVCVSYPDSDLSFPIILAIGGDGSYTIQRDESLDGMDE